MESGVAFLMYHELELSGRGLCQSDPGYTRYIVPASVFESQMSHLKNIGYQGVSVGRALEFNGGQNVCVTFDDGCETDLEVAAPKLSALGFDATFYITVGFLGRRGYMTEAQVRDLASRGFEVGCHSMTHPYLPDLDAAGQHQEISVAKVRLEQILGQKVDHFSCPGGRFDDRVLAAVKKAGYRTLATSRLQLNSNATDRFNLGRIAVLRSTTTDELVNACRGVGFWKLTWQQTLRDSAKKILGNQLYDRLRATVLGNGN